ncbi:hypothetical protein ACFLRZ_03820 [Bacteroidota bacterium]
MTHQGSSLLRNNYFITVLNSTAVFIIAYLFVYLVYQFATVLMAADYEIQTILYYNTIKFITPDFSSLWNADSALVIFGVGPLVSVVLGIISFFLFMEMIDDPSTLKLFLLWGSVHFFIRTFSSFTIGTIFFLYGSNLVADWLRVGWGGKMMLSILSIAFITVIGIFSTNAFVQSSNSLHLIKNKVRMSFIVCQVLLPWLIGSSIIILVELPDITLHEMLIMASFIFVVTQILWRNHQFVLYGQESEIPEQQLRISWITIIIVIVFVITFRLGLNQGIYFG